MWVNSSSPERVDKVSLDETFPCKHKANRWRMRKGKSIRRG